MKPLKKKVDRTYEQLTNKWTPRLRRFGPTIRLATCIPAEVEGQDPEIEIFGRQNLSNVKYVLGLWERVRHNFPDVSLTISMGPKPTRLYGYGLLDIELEPLSLRFQRPTDLVHAWQEVGKFDDVFAEFSEGMSDDERRIQIERLNDRLRIADMEWALCQGFAEDLSRAEVSSDIWSSTNGYIRTAFETEKKHIEAMLKVYESFEAPHEE